MATKELDFEFLNTPRIIFGRGKITTLEKELESYGSSIFLVGSRSALQLFQIKKLTNNLSSNIKNKLEIVEIKGEPDTIQIEKNLKIAKKAQRDVVVSIGGGSVIDSGKIIAGLLTNGGAINDYLEVIGKGLPLTKPSVPFIAIPTTAGTGSEATRNAVIFSPKNKLKVSIRSPYLIPKLAIIDPELMLTNSKEVTASCGLDVLTQLIEAYTSNKAQQITDSLAILGIKKVVKSLIDSFENGANLSAREDMAFGALLSGICLTNSGLGAVHGFAGVIGGLFNIPHGKICGMLLPHVIEENIANMIKSVPFHKTLTKYAHMGKMVSKITFEDIRDNASQLIDYLKHLVKILKIPRLSDFGLNETMFKIIINNAKNTSSMKYNPIQLTDESLNNILKNSS